MHVHLPKPLRGWRAFLEEYAIVVLGVLTFPSWDFPIVHDTGEILMPLPGENPDGGHAVCVGEAPELFRIGDDGKVEAILAEPPPSLHAKAAAAAQYCPTRAMKAARFALAYGSTTFDHG